MSSRLSGCLRHALPIFSLAFAGVGCGDNKPPLPMVENYAEAWQQASPPDLNGVGAAPTELRWQAGTLYYRNRDVPSTIVALPVGPGVAPAPQVVSNEDSFRIWVEGDQVLYSQSETLKAVPTGGGPPVTVLQGPDSFGISGSQRLEVAVQDLDANYFYYDTWRITPDTVFWNVWRLPRAGGDPQKLAESATFVEAAFERFDHGPAGILTTDFNGRAWLIPDDGSGIHELNDDGRGRVIGGDASNVLWQRYGAGNAANHEMFEVWRGAPDLPATVRLWALPPNIAPESAAPDGAQGWFFGTIEYFSDNLIHSSFWHLDASGNATRIAANPSVHEEVIESMVAAPDAVYAALAVFDSPAQWMILRLPLEAPVKAAEVSSAFSELAPEGAAPFALAATFARHAAIR